MAQGDKLHPLQQKFPGTCRPAVRLLHAGLLVASKALLDDNPNPTETEVRYWLAGNLCRCTGYDKIIRAVHGCGCRVREIVTERPHELFRE